MEYVDGLTDVETLLEWWDSYDLPGHKGVKLGMGGAIESGSEALIDGYADPDVSARPVVDAEPFASYVRQLDAAGFQLKVHGIGDGTVRATLDGYETVIRENGNNRLRHHIAHCSLSHPDDFQRFVDLDVTCTIWPPLNVPIDYNVGRVVGNGAQVRGREEEDGRCRALVSALHPGASGLAHEGW